MKTGKLKLLQALCLSLLISFVACSDDDDDSGNFLESNYFKIEDANYVNSAFPSASETNAPSVNSITGNSSIIAGGSNPITIDSDADFESILIGIDGENGYYEMPVSELKSTSSLYVVYLIIIQELELDYFDIVIAIIDGDGNVSSHSYISVEKIEAGTGDLQISCSWNQENDLDLHLEEPNGEEIYYGNYYSANNGILDIDSNAGCYIDGINNENITYSEDSSIVETGEYIVRLDLYSNCSVTESTNAVVNVLYQGESITPSYGENPYYGTFTASDADYGSSGDGRVVMKFTIDELKSATETDTYKLVFPSAKTQSKNLSPNK